MTTTEFAPVPQESDLRPVPCSNRPGILEMMEMRRDPFTYAD